MEVADQTLLPKQASLHIIHGLFTPWALAADLPSHNKYKISNL